MKLFNQVSLNSWPIYRKLSDEHLGYLLNFSNFQECLLERGILTEAICHKLLQREAVLSFPFIFKLLNTEAFHHSQHSRGVLGLIRPGTCQWRS